MDINRAFTGQSSEKIIEDSKEMDTLQFKLRLAAIINEHLDPLRENYHKWINDENRMKKVLERGEEEARPIIRRTLDEVKRMVGFE